MGNLPVNGYTDVVGKHGAWIGDHTGPASYTTGGETLEATFFGLRSLDVLLPENLSKSGNYEVKSQAPAAAGGVKVSGNLIWYFAPTANGLSALTIAGAGSGYTNGTYTVAPTGGGGSGASVKLTVSGGAITGAVILAPGTGYTSAPTIPLTALGAGTGGSVTATVGGSSGTQVPTGTNLSGESVRLLVVGG